MTSGKTPPVHVHGAIIAPIGSVQSLPRTYPGKKMAGQ